MKKDTVTISEETLQTIVNFVFDEGLKQGGGNKEQFRPVASIVNGKWYIKGV